MPGLLCNTICLLVLFDLEFCLLASTKQLMLCYGCVHRNNVEAGALPLLRKIYIVKLCGRPIYICFVVSVSWIIIQIYMNKLETEKQDTMSDQSQGESSLINRQPRQPPPAVTITWSFAGRRFSLVLSGTWIYVGEGENYGDWSRV